MAHSTKKLRKMIDRQQERIAKATTDLEGAVAEGDLEAAATLRNSLRSHRANVMRWQKVINRRDEKKTSTAAIERSGKPAARWRSHNHTPGEKRASQADRKRSWRMNQKTRDHDILRSGRKAVSAATRADDIPGMDWTGTSRT